MAGEITAFDGQTEYLLLAQLSQEAESAGYETDYAVLDSLEQRLTAMQNHELASEPRAQRVIKSRLGYVAYLKSELQSRAPDLAAYEFDSADA